MGKRSSRSRKGLSTAVGTAFFIIVVIISMSSIWAIGAFQARYQGITDQMNDWDTQRISENLNIRNVDNTTLVEGLLNYNFSITVDGNGGVPVNIVRIYVYNQSRPVSQSSKRLWIYNPINASAGQPRSGFNHSMVNTGEVAHVIAVNGTKFRGSFQYRIILTTDRGRQFSYSYPPIGGGAGGGGYPIVMAADRYNFQYYAYQPTLPYPLTAYDKAISTTTDRPLYRILVNNTTEKNVIWQRDCQMLQLSSSGGTNIVRRYIVSSATNTANADPTAFSSQILASGEGQYLYFAGSTNGTTTPSWVGDPSGRDQYYVLGFLLYFNYEGESELRILSLPSPIQHMR